MSYKDYGYQTNERNHVHSYILQPLLARLEKVNARLILDVGCGNGWLVDILVKNGYDAYGIDASVSGIGVAQQLYPDRFFVQNVDQEALPVAFQHLAFDTIVSTEVIEHVYSPQKYLQFCHQVLSKSNNGTLLLTTPYHGYWKNLALALSGKMDKHFTVLWEGGHIKFWSKKTIYQALEENGFNMTYFEGCGRIPLLWKSMLIEAKLGHK